VIQLPDGTEIIGRIPRSSDDAGFYYFNNSDFAATKHSIWKLKFNGAEFDLASVSPEALKNAGAEMTVPDFAPNEVHAFFGWGVQNRDGGVSVTFKDGRVSELQMRWHLSTSSPFAISFDKGEFLSMPFTESQIHSALGKPVKTSDVFYE
jgi:hypothetical protein